MNRWPAAKYLSYAFWRSYILAVYTAPIWANLLGGKTDNDCSFWMYVWSTIAFALVTAILAINHKKVGRFLFSSKFMLGCGVVSALGMCTEYTAATLFGGGGNPVFALGAVLTGIGTGCIAVRAGQIYAAARPVATVTNTSLSELASGLVYFLVVGTLAEFGLAIAALLPLAAGIMTLFDTEESVGREKEALDRKKHVEVDEKTRRSSCASFIRFLFIIFVLTFVANLIRTMFTSHDMKMTETGNAVGITLVIVVCFALAVLSTLLRSFDFSVVYYPLVLLLAFSLVLAFTADSGSVTAQAITLLVYTLFSLFTWVLLSLLARGDYWNPVEVLGWGRSMFAVGSLCGLLVGRYADFDVLTSDESLVFGLVLAFLLVAAAMLVFTENDVEKITKAAWLSRECSEGFTEEASSGSPSSASIASGEEGKGRPFARDVSMEAPRSAQDSGKSVETASIEDYADEHNLTRREREVFALMLRGRDAKSIGEELVISDNTAKAHIRSIYAKTGVHTRQEFMRATDHVER